MDIINQPGVESTPSHENVESTVPGTEFQGRRGEMSPLNFWTRGAQYILSPINILW